ncbi:MAG: GNAT family N-acetyltransferase [Dehalococcoidia bacterium]
MAIELRSARPEDVSELGRICYEAFKDISERHGFLSDFSTVEFAQQVVGLLVQNEQVYGVAAFEDGAAKGSNFLNMWGEVAGVGPVSVDVGSQGRGIGRQTMTDVVAHGRAQGYEMIRLCQDSFNMQSLALYSSLGFDTKEPLSYVALSQEGALDPNLRPATADDLDAMDELCRSVYLISRKGECAVLMGLGFPALTIDRGGRVAGYLLGTALGHGVAESEDDMLALLAGLGVSVPESHSFVPLRQGELYRRALAAGHRNTKVMNLMALGPYEEPQGTFCPSVMF